MSFIDITGKKYNQLTVVKRVTNNKHDKARWLCLCGCGSRVIVLGQTLRNGRTKCCKNCHKAKLLKANTKHGLCRHPLYCVWDNMKQRCKNQNQQSYKDYGGKGIMVCDEWDNDFKAFYEWAISSGYKNGLTIDRIDNNKGYFPDNCRWATRAEQNRNTSRVNLVLYGDKYITTAQVAKIIGVTRSTSAKWYNSLGFRTFPEFLKRKQENRKNQYA